MRNTNNAAPQAQITILDRLLGTSLIVALVLPLVYPKSAVISLFLVAIVALMSWSITTPRTDLQIPRTLALPFLIAYIAWALVSCAWTPDPQKALGTIIAVAATMGAGLFILMWTTTQSEHRLLFFSDWLLISYICATTILLWLTIDQRPIVWIVETFELYRPGETTKLIEKMPDGSLHAKKALLNTCVATATAFLFPVCAIAWKRLEGRPKYAILGTACSLVYLIVFLSDHETSKLALVIAPIVFLGSLLLKQKMTLLIAATWVCLTIGIIPITSLAHSPLELHQANWIQKSAQHRITIWADYSNRATDRIVLGHGARSSKHLSKMKEPATVWLNLRGTSKSVARHPHNASLQTAFELGLVGSVLLMGLGLSLLRLTSVNSPFALTTFSVSMIIFTACWDLWEAWQISMFMLATLFLCVAAALPQSGTNADSETRQSIPNTS